MAYKVGSTVVIDNNGKIDWGRIKTSVTLTKGSDVVNTSGSGNIVTKTRTGMRFDAENVVRDIYTETRRNCNCNCNCNCRC